MTNNDFHKLGIKTGQNEIWNCIENAHYICEFCKHNKLATDKEIEETANTDLLRDAIEHIFDYLILYEAEIENNEKVQDWLLFLNYHYVDYKDNGRLIGLELPDYDEYDFEVLRPIINFMHETEGQKVEQGDKAVKKLYDYFKSEIERG